VRVARVEPERRLEQLRHRRQHALAGEIEVVGKPTLGHQKTDELLGGGDMATPLKTAAAKKSPLIGKASPSGPSGHSIVEVFS
jgi:hypothetical protein